MTFDLRNFQDGQLDAEYVAYIVDQQAPDVALHFGRLWDYFRNPMVPALGPSAGTMNSSSRPYFQAQEVGLPARITGIQRCGDKETPTDIHRKEVVIENDIAWRLQTMVDYLFGRTPVIRSRAADHDLAAANERLIATLLDANGGIALLQEAALLGTVYGFVDIALRIPADGLTATPKVRQAASQPADATSTPANAGGPGTSAALDAAVAAIRTLQLEAVEAPRILPILHEFDYHRLRYWIQKFRTHPARLADSRKPWLGLLGRGRAAASSPASVEVIEIMSPDWWQRYEDRQLAAEGPIGLGCLPIVHVQNLPLTGSYAGLSDVEPLVPLQDELNTRLSDRAQRVTYQSFKMYLGKGIDDFLERPVGPGQMWATANPEATIEEFGSDDGSPSEDAHIEQVRAALDKASGVSPLAAGLIKGNVGYLTSATALRVLLSGLMSRTARKRLTYGHGIEQIVDLALTWLDRAGIWHTTPADRQIEIHWPSMAPTDDAEQLRNAQIKAQLGVPTARILAELGYAPQE